MNEVEKFAAKNKWNIGSIKTFPNVRELSNFVVIMVPNWSPQDFLIIDSVKNQLNKLNIPIFLFDLESFDSGEQIKELFPGSPEILSTPAILVFRFGSICCFFREERGISILRDVC